MRIRVAALLLSLVATNGFSQITIHPVVSKYNVITTTIPFLTINPNAQSAGIGGIGVVASDEYSESGLTQNPALLSRGKKIMGAKLSFTPWLTNIVKGMYITDFGMFYSLKRGLTLGYSFNHFTHGKIVFTNINGNPQVAVNPAEWYHSIRASQALTKHLSIGMGFKYAVSDLLGGQYLINGIQYQKGKTVAADLGVDYRNKLKATKNWKYSVGASILNIGNKITYTPGHTGDFIPTSFKVGTMWTHENKLSHDVKLFVDLAYQAEKLLVPTWPQMDATGTVILRGMDPNVSVPQGMLQSFFDAPGGLLEELREIAHILGAEARMKFGKDITAAIRTGTFLESQYKGNRKIFYCGFGGSYKGFYADLARSTQRWNGGWAWNAAYFNVGYRMILK